MQINKLSIIIFVVLLSSCGTKNDIVQKEPEKTNLTSSYYKMAIEQFFAFEKSGFSDMDKYDLAEKYFNEAIFAEPEDADVWFNSGRLFFYSGKYTRAKESFKNAIKYRKAFVEAYSMLAKTYLSDGDKEGALNVMLKANEAVPDNNDIMNNTALVYMETGNLNYARTLSEKIIKKSPKFIPAYVTLGNVYYYQKKYEYARFIYLKALDEGGDNGEIYTNLGLVTSKLEGKDQSYDLLKKGVDKSPNNSYTHLNMGELLLSSGDYEGALSELKLAVKINPRLVEALVDIGIAYTHVSLFEEAKESYDKAILYNSSYAEAYFNYGVLLGDYMLKPQEAIEMFKKFIALKSGEIKDTHRVYKYIENLNQRLKVK